MAYIIDKDGEIQEGESISQETAEAAKALGEFLETGTGSYITERSRHKFLLHLLANYEIRKRDVESIDTNCTRPQEPQQ